MGPGYGVLGVFLVDGSVVAVVQGTSSLYGVAKARNDVKNDLFGSERLADALHPFQPTLDCHIRVPLHVPDRFVVLCCTWQVVALKSCGTQAPHAIFPPIHLQMS